MQVGQHQLALVRVQAGLQRQDHGRLLPGEGAALQGRPHLQAGHGHAEHADLLVRQRVQGDGAHVVAWMGDRERDSLGTCLSVYLYVYLHTFGSMMILQNMLLSLPYDAVTWCEQYQPLFLSSAASSFTPSMFVCTFKTESETWIFLQN